MNSLKVKLTLVLLLMALLPLLTLGIVIYNQTTAIFTDSIQQFLLTIVESKDAVLENYIDETEILAQSLADTDQMQAYIALANQVGSAEQNEQRQALAEEVNNLLYSIQEAHWGKYHHIFLIDRSQHIVVSPNHGENERGSPSSHLFEDTSGNQWAAQALEEGVLTVSDYSSWVESDHTHQMLFFPVKDELNQTQAVLGFELQIPYEQEILTENVQLGQNGSIYLTTVDGVPIVYQGMDEQVPLQTDGITKAQAFGSSFGRRQNADGVEVIDVYLKNARHPWILVAEIEAAEAFENLDAIQTTILLGLLVTLILIIFISIVLSNLIVNPLKELTKQMEEVSLGKLDVRVSNVGRTDEIGQLVNAFNRIVKSLKLAMKNYTTD